MLHHPDRPVSVLVLVEIGELHVQRIRQAVPSATIVYAPNGAGASAAVRGAEVIFAKGIPPALLPQAGALRWVQAGTAGIDGLLRFPEIRDGSLLLTNAGGVHGIPMAEQVLAFMLAFAIRLPTLIDGQRRATVVSRLVIAEKFELEGQTIVVVGVGDIGRTLCKKCQALGLHVIGVRRRQIARPPWAHEMVTTDQLCDMLPRADHVALCLPGTSATQHLLGKRELGLMKPTAYLYNVGRGSAIDQDALIEAIEAGSIAGAGLDVSTPDPPDPTARLWQFDQVLLGQHTSGSSPFNFERITNLFIDNLRRYLRGEPLVNLVDKAAGYPPDQSYTAPPGGTIPTSP